MSAGDIAVLAGISFASLVGAIILIAFGCAICALIEKDLSLGAMGVVWTLTTLYIAFVAYGVMLSGQDQLSAIEGFAMILSFILRVIGIGFLIVTSVLFFMSIFLALAYISFPFYLVLRCRVPRKELCAE